ncbi:GDP-mannose 4,6-dehydratase [Dongia sp.]|uniref:GDP-mannose 4,6-dehydratase n=1 Tax=Dongia sp. TaxID=1977262 RepID=UPI0035B38DD6
MASYLVIGSNSFSGAGFVDYLLSQGIDTVGVSRSEEVAMPFRIYAWDRRDAAFNFHRIDLNHDLDALMALIDRERPSRIVNFAAQSMVGESWQHPDHWMMTNVVSAVRLHERLRHLDFLEKYVHVTTPEVYGSTEGWVREDCHFQPSTPYAVSRAAGDMSLRSFHEAYAFPVLFTRAANVYGPGQQLYRILPRTILYALTGKRLQLHGGGYSTRSFIHVRDVAAATYLVAEHGRLGDTYHISTTKSVTIRDLVAGILRKLGLDIDACVEEVGERLGKDNAYMLDTGKIRAELGWSDEISLESGIRQTIDWVRENLTALQQLPQSYVHKP